MSALGMAAMTAADVGPLELLVIQPTPFCNIDCSYCYLPDRQNTRKMTLDTLTTAFDWVFSSGLVREPFELLWHAGEPLVMPPAFYDSAAELLRRHDRDGTLVTQSFQTNATLIDAQWCDLIRRLDIHVGVSVDGPAFLHDRCRRTRQGAGTLDRVLRGLHCLQEHGIPLHVITVLTAEALAYADELFNFYRSHGITEVAFNIEEIEGPHTTSSLTDGQVPARFRRFLSRFLDLALAADPPLVVREFECSVASIVGKRLGRGDRVQENRPFAIVNVGCDGQFSTYSPELLGLSSSAHGSFALGHVATDSLASVLASPRFCALEEEIASGVEMCERQCRYFAFCGGGPPGNKFFENGTFASTATMFCRLHKQACLDVSMDKLERKRVFTLPEHLRSAFWEIMEQAEGDRDFNGFAAEVGRCLRFEQLPSPEDAVFEVLLFGAGGEIEPHSLWAVINMGEEPVSVDLTGLRLCLELGQGIRQPENAAARILPPKGELPHVLVVLRRPVGVDEESATNRSTQ